ncbi:hypothetical protein LWE69_19905 [Paenibacillus sp. UKAQ_18]|nr:hypothetical protein [Paenibacillus sp. UKAQ_18]
MSDKKGFPQRKHLHNSVDKRSARLVEPNKAVDSSKTDSSKTSDGGKK